MTALLELRHVDKRFGGVHATRDVSFTVDEGEILGVIGPNGAGKSTLFELVSGFVNPDSGEILHAGRPIHRLSPSAVSRRGVVRTFQKLRPFPDLTCLENVMIGALVGERRTSRARQTADAALHRVGLEHRRDVHARGLSTGQRKRLEVARALATGARLLLLDEVTGGVDPGARQQLVDLVRGLNAEGVSIVLIEHDMRVMESLAHRVLALHLGRVLTLGPPADVIADERVRQAYLGGQA
ncbi:MULTISPECIES: ABC transporter ATP-binding protein [unclassified Micromonospora]|uniref:ABC transporter ATP-binding protein n=1 Tax=unclassified Micromonospora TaxID=2617518 RepID=UPI0010341CF2|nr:MULTISPECIES: ABC transporter ATP-binding protein [unclassified Micromonospora]QKW17157.1 ABC transporter ATP-binding protein [Verrucosispora sp. NA02020]TBL44523.1 ABC transporter ATP-binding protein [Verrucosispora sp. SN26_14.1]